MLRYPVATVTILVSCSLLIAQSQSPEAKIRVYVTDSQSWQMSGGFGGSSEHFAGAIKGGARPQTAEIIKTFGERCPAVTVTNNRDKADFVVLLDHEGGKGLLRHRNKVTGLGRGGDAPSHTH